MSLLFRWSRCFCVNPRLSPLFHGSVNIYLKFLACLCAWEGAEKQASWVFSLFQHGCKVNSPFKKICMTKPGTMLMFVSSIKARFATVLWLVWLRLLMISGIRTPECKCILCVSSADLFVAWSACASQCVAAMGRLLQSSTGSFLHRISVLTNACVTAWMRNEMAFHPCICLEAASSRLFFLSSLFTFLPSEHGGQRSHLNHLLPLI